MQSFGPLKVSNYGNTTVTTPNRGAAKVPRAAAARQSVTASKQYLFESEYVFQARAFTELQHAQAIVLPYDGLNPLPPQYCYLKPYYLNVETSYFDHLARRAL